MFPEPRRQPRNANAFLFWTTEGSANFDSQEFPMSLVAGIDAGTQSVKVVVYDPASRQLVDAASAPLELIHGGDGSREQHPSDWVHAMHACFDRFDAGLRSRIGALAVSGQQHGFVPLDAEGRVLAPAKLWCDTSTVAECDEIMARVGGPAACIA